MQKRLMIRCLLIVIFVASLATGQSRAQEITPQPEQGFIYQWESEVLFPLYVRFHLVLDAPADQLSTARLTLQPENGTPTEINVSINQFATTREPFTVIEFVWTVPPSAPPAYNTSVEYQWRVTTNGGGESAVSDVFIYADWRVIWTQTEANEASFLTLFLPDEDLAPQDVRTSLQPVYDLLSRNTGRSLNFAVLLYSDALPPAGCVENEDGDSVIVGLVSGLEMPCRPADVAAVFEGMGLTVLQSAASTLSLASAHKTLSTYMVEQFYAEHWAGVDVPAWFQSGLTQLYQPASKAGLFTDVAAAARAGRLYSLQQMTTFQSDELWQAQSYAMVLYLASRVGFEAVFGFADALGNAVNFADAYQVAFGEPVNALLPGLEVWIFSDAAVSAFGVSPYQRATFTPTITNTPTATDTPTATSTPTATPTATETGIPQTPLPTRTPTFTPSPVTPSVTPRPAGSLNTPTATPVLISESTEINNDGLLIGVLLVIFVVLAVLSFIFLQRTRS